MSLRVAFVLPAPVRVPSGGAAVVYRHAEHLARRGHQVSVFAPRALARGGEIRAHAVGLWNRMQQVPDQTVYTARDVATLEPRRLPLLDCYDAVIATGMQTIMPVLQQRTRGEGRVHFIQGDETFLDRAARETWDEPFHRITVSEWLAAAVRARGASVIGTVSNAIGEEFRDGPPPDVRPPAVLALYHRHPVKGPAVLVETLRRLRASHPDAALAVFSARRPSHRMPEGVRVHVRPTAAALRELYRHARVFLHTSEREGWALTPMEAAASGCAIVATSSLGVAEFLRPGSSMVQVEVGDAAALAREAGRLLDLPEAARALGARAQDDVRRFSWDVSTASFEALVVRAAASPP